MILLNYKCTGWDAVQKLSLRRLMLFCLSFVIAVGAAHAQNGLTIKGKVLDAETQQAIASVTLTEKGTTNSTKTDAQGNFQLAVKSLQTALQVSYVGYLTQEVSVNGSSDLVIRLATSNTSLDEVVIVGYGQTKRSDVTGSISSMDAKSIQQTNKTNAFQAMQGQVAGVNIQAADNKPGSGFNVRIRGANTINSSESISNAGFSAGQNPLFVVDGIFVNDISFLNPSDIERMDILKDASATAIYGSRGTNGVIIIATKRGAKGKTVVSYENYFGTKEAYHLPRMLQGEEFVQYLKDAVVGNKWASGNYDFTVDDVVLSDYMRPNELENMKNGNYTNWIDLVNKNGFQTNHTFNVSGGGDKATYGAGMAYTKDEGTFEGEKYERFSLRGNVSAEILPKVTFNYNNYVAFAIRDEGSLEGLRSAYRLRPTGSAYDANGEPQFFPLEGETFITNPLFEADNWTLETRALNYIGNISLAYTPVKGLRLSTNFSPNIEFRRLGEYRGRYSKSTSGNQANTRAEVINSNRISWTWDNIVNYDADLGEDHSLSGTFVYSLFLDRSENYQMQRRNFATDEFLFYNVGAGSVINSMTSALTKQTLESYTGRLNYGYKSKYLLTFTGRYDGSSILAPGNKWAFFPSAAFAWRVINESFMKTQQTVSDLKLRLSYGETGNNGAGGGLAPLGSQSLVGAGFTNIGDKVVQTNYITNLANQNLTWEKTKEWNLGVDFGFLKNRLTGTVDIYNRHNTGIIFYRPTSTVTGYSGVFENVGEGQNRGVEVLLNTKNINGENFKWTTSLNFALNKNKLTKLYNNLEEIIFSIQSGTYIHRVGESIGSAYTWDFDGIWQLDEIEEAAKYGQKPGQVRVKDIDGNGVINADDRVIIGNNMPDWTGGITNTFNYKNVDFSFFVNTSQGVVATSYMHQSHGGGFDSTPARFNSMKMNYWTPDNPSNEWYQPSNNGPYTEAVIFQDLSYVKVGYITLGYTFGNSLLQKTKLKSVRLYATAQNPFIFTDYKGSDPETAGRNSYGAAHLTRTFMAGLNVNF